MEYAIKIFPLKSEIHEVVTLTTAETTGEKCSFRKVVTRDTQQLEPHWKKTSINLHDFENQTFFPPETYSYFTKMNTLWSLTKCLLPNTIPFWTGWNSLRITEANLKQVVCYMDHIQLPPTRLNGVTETLKRSQAMARECGEQYSIATYDLAVAKIAQQIQFQETPKFDVFVKFGPFHCVLSFFSSLGRIIEGSGGPFVLIESKLIASGSLNRFLKGKFYNRHGRGHILLSTVLRCLHFQRFLRDNEIDELIL